MPTAGASRERSIRAFLLVLYALATYQFMRRYMNSTYFYLRFNDYLYGHERLPFQERVLPAVLIRLMILPHWFVRLSTGHQGVFSTPERGASFLLSMVGFAVAAYFTQLLYAAVSQRRTLGFLVFPCLFWTVIWTYLMLGDQNYSYPYDMLSLAFFTAGVYAIYTRRFWALLGIVLVGTFNRETTLFLIPMYMLDQATVPGTGWATPLRQRFHPGRIPWPRVALLAVTWAVVKFTLAHIFAGNDRSEDYVRLRVNLMIFNPKHWSETLNLCGYLLPVVLLFRRRIESIRFGSYAFVLLPWLLIMAYVGLLTESRIWGELCSFTAVAAILELEQYVASTARIEVPVADLAALDT